jgi:hypothetical protein
MWVTQATRRVACEMFEVRSVVLAAPMRAHWHTALAAAKVQVAPTLFDGHFLTAVTQLDSFRHGYRGRATSTGFGTGHSLLKIRRLPRAPHILLGESLITYANSTAARLISSLTSM